MQSPMEPQAVKIARIIAERVKRPGIMPVPDEWGRLRFLDTDGTPRYCPLGLLPKAFTPAPQTKLEAGLFAECDSAAPFWKWWDRQSDAKGAMDEVWGNQG